MVHRLGFRQHDAGLGQLILILWSFSQFQSKFFNSSLFIGGSNLSPE